jgi:predicted metal-binding membrane protein
MGPLPRSLRGLIVGAIFAACAAATVWWCTSMPAGMPMPGGWTMSMAWMRMPGASWISAGAAFVASWALMMTAMMMPSIAPVLLGHRRPVRVALAYFGVWIGAGVLVYPAGAAIAAGVMSSREIAARVPLAIGAACVIAGLVQLTRWKMRELARCRDRSCCAIGRRPGPRDAWRDGARIGGHCVRCCAPAMTVLCVLGVMDLAPMAIVGAAISAERLAPRPRWIVRATGAAAIAWGALAIARAL